MSLCDSAKKTLTIGDRSLTYWDILSVGTREQIERLPFTLRLLLENVLRHADNNPQAEEQCEALLHWQADNPASKELSFVPARVILQDFTGVPAIVDLAAMRDAMCAFGQSAESINPLSPVELVIDHSVMVDDYNSSEALSHNTTLEYARNHERYTFLRWGQMAFDNFKVVPPGTGIVHQVNLEYLARVVFQNQDTLYPDTLVGTDSHTTMINGLGVLGWGVGGIEAEAAMLGQAIPLLLPKVVGVELTGTLPVGSCATDLVLTITEQLRQLGVVGKFVEFFGAGLNQLPLADRATIANMAPEYGATCGFFPIDEETCAYLSLTGRDDKDINTIKQYCQANVLFHDETTPNPTYSESLRIDLSTIVPSLAGPKRPQDRIPLTQAQHAFQNSYQQWAADIRHQKANPEGNPYAQGHLPQGAVLIAAITSCTNTSNPAVMLTAGLLARKAHALGLRKKPWVKTSLAPGSQVVTDYLEAANLMPDLQSLGFHLVGYGCTTCIGNSGPLDDDIMTALSGAPLLGCAVLSGNRNFEGRIHPMVQNAYLASPPLVIAYALAGDMRIDFDTTPLGQTPSGNAIYLKDIWPTAEEIQKAIANITPDLFKTRYASVFKGESNWRALSVPEGDVFQWDDASTYVKKPPFFEDITLNPSTPTAIQGARVLALLGNSVTTDHISPAGAIATDSPAAQYLTEQGVATESFNSYGSRRGNHEVMMRGTFANIRLRNQLADNKEGGWTTHFPSGQLTTIYDAAMRYIDEKTPLIILAGQEYGTGSSRDWAAKGTRLLGVKAVIAQSFERIHRSNLIGMGVLPLAFLPEQSADTLGLTGEENFDIPLHPLTPRGQLQVMATHPKTQKKTPFQVRICIDTPQEMTYYEHGGILHYVLRQLAKQSGAA